MIPFGNWLFPFFDSWRVLDAGSFAKQFQQLVTGLELTTDRGSALGQLVSAPPPPQPPALLPSLPLSDKFRPSTKRCLSLSLSLASSLSSATMAVIRHGALGVKGVQADGQVLTCRMITIRQKTLIGFNWKSIMGLIAAPSPLPPRRRPRMASVIRGPSLSGWPRREISDWLARLWCVKLH